MALNLQSLPDDVPMYRITNTKGFYADNDTLYPENTVLGWKKEPNEEMEPLNEPARKRMDAHIKRLEEGARAYAKKMGREFVGRETDRVEAAAAILADAKGGLYANSAVVTTGKRDTPVQGHLTSDQGLRKTHKAGSGVTSAELPVQEKPMQPMPILGSNFEQMLTNKS